MKNNEINFKHFLKLNTCQPYFIWHDLDVKTSEIFEDNNLSFQLDSFKLNNDNFSELQFKLYKNIEKVFLDKIAKEYPNHYLVKSKSKIEKIAETKKAMLDKKIDFIFNPVFCFSFEGYDVISNFAVIDKKNKELILLKFSTSTKVQDFAKVYFDYCVFLEQNYFVVKKIALYILATKKYHKGEIDFYKSYYINCVKNTRHDKSLKATLNFYEMQKLRAGEAKETRNILEIIKSNKFYKIGKFHNHLKQIISAQNVTTMQAPLKVDVSNKHFPDLVQKFCPKYANYSGYLISKNDIIDKVNLKELDKKSEIFNIFHHAKEIFFTNKKEIQNRLFLLKQKNIWYDLEAFSLPIAPFDYFLPFQQVISQVSIIETINNKEISKNNIVLDPLNISWNDLIKIINKIYHYGYYYVVYNKSYENARLEEIGIRLLNINHKKAKIINKKIQYIIKHTIDLADFFSCSSKRAPWIVIPELKGKYSIKFLENYISNNCKDLNYKINQYKDLDVKNGLMAMDLANKRAWNIIGNKQWKKEKKKLKIYCENDVRAMIMVYKFIQKLIK